MSVTGIIILITEDDVIFSITKDNVILSITEDDVIILYTDSVFIYRICLSWLQYNSQVVAFHINDYL